MNVAKLMQCVALTLGSIASCKLSTSYATQIKFESVDGEIQVEGEPFYMKGVNWFGQETIEKVPQGLWPYGTNVDKMLDLLQDYNVNAIRLPLAIDSILADETIPKDQVAGTVGLIGKSYLEMLDVVINKCRERNMVVILDNQRMEAAEPDFPDIADAAGIIPALEVLAERYCDNPSTWNVIGIDIKNEPKGKATWGTGDAKTDWDIAAAKIGNAILKKCKRMLIFVQGVQTNIEGVTLKWGQVGGSLQGVADHPVNLTIPGRVVYSPHLISPAVDFKAPWWYDSSFPANMDSVWDDYFGFVPKKSGSAVVVGSWSAKTKGQDAEWSKALTNYLAKNSISSFYWAINPQSADTGGLLSDDWSTAIEERFEVLSGLPSTSLKTILKKFGMCKADSDCKGYGQCVDGECSCWAGWTGPQCDICTPGDTKACNEAGVCQLDSTCACDTGVKGAYCLGGCDAVHCGSLADCADSQCYCRYEGNMTPCSAGNVSTDTTDSTADDVQSCSSCPTEEASAASTLISFVAPLATIISLALLM